LAAQSANLSSDGYTIHIRGEGWKEVKLSTVSAVEWVRDEDHAGPTLAIYDPISVPNLSSQW
jgi:hypothetical protein